jgi:hypothetical protein
MGEQIATKTVVPVAVKARPRRSNAKAAPAALAEKGIASSLAGMQPAPEK